MSDVITELANEANDKAMEIAWLNAENANLQETLHRRTEQFEGMTNMWAKRGVENFKLRELVRWMYDRMDESCAVQHPYAPAPISYDCLMQAWARARELGIEVDG